MSPMGLGINVDWHDLVQPSTRKKCLGTHPLTMVSQSFYTCQAADCLSLAEELEFLAANVAYVKKELEVVSETLTFSSDGQEAPKPSSITADEL